MKSLKILGFLILLMAASQTVFAAGNNLFVNGVSKGQYTDLNAVNACGQTARTGLKGILDMGCANQASTSAITAPETLIQASTVQGSAQDLSGTPPAIKITCTQDTSGKTTCADYSTTNSAKVGSIAININGTTVFLRTYNAPN